MLHRPRVILAIIVLLSLILCASANANRLMKYDRATGAITTFKITNQSIGPLAMNSTSVAYWGTDGVKLYNLATGAVNKLSSDAYVNQAYFELSDNYITWNGKLMDLNTSVVSNVDPNAKLSGNYLVSGSGASYTAYNLATGQQTSINAANGIELASFAGTTAVVKDGLQYKTDRFGDKWYDVSYSAYDITTGAATGWKGRISTNYYAPNPIVNASDNLFVASYCQPNSDFSYYAYCPLGNSNAQWQYMDRGLGQSIIDMDGNASLFYCYSSSLSWLTIHDWMTKTNQGVYTLFMDNNQHIGSAEMNADYVVWSDNMVPEPASCASLVLGLGGLVGFIRRKSK